MRAIYALAWEQWRLTRQALYVAISLSLFIVLPRMLIYISLSQVSMPGLIADDIVNIDMGGAIDTIFFFVGVYFLFACSDAYEIGPSPQRHHFVLPRRTRKVAAAVFFSRIFFFGLSLYAMRTLHALSFPNYLFWPEQYEILLHTVKWTSLLAIAQAILWWPMFVRVIVGVSGFFVVLHFLVNPPPVLLNLVNGTTGLVLAFGVIMAASLCFAERGWSRYRHGVTALPGFVLRLGDALPTMFSPRTDSPCSSKWTQLWFEWRIFGVYIWLIAMAIVFVPFLFYVPFIWKTPSSIASYFSVQYAVGPMAAAVIWNLLFFMKSPFEHGNADVAVKMALPVRTSVLATSRLYAGLFGLTSSYAAIAILFTACNLFTNIQPLPRSLVFLAPVLFIITWALLWLGSPKTYILIVAVEFILFVPSGCLAIAGSYGSPFCYDFLLSAAIITVVTLVILVSVFREDVPIRGKLFAVFLIWLPLAVFLHMKGYFAFDFPGSYTNALRMFMAASFALLPALPLLTVPLSIERMRHGEKRVARFQIIRHEEN